MVAILTDDIFKCIFLNENDITPIQISMKCVHKGLSDNKSAFGQVMAGHRTCNRPLPELMKTQVTDAYMKH